MTTSTTTAPTSKGPRPAVSYRGARRNATKAARMLPVWRATVSDEAEVRAHISARAVQANNAREAAAKALINNRAGRPDLVMATAYLEFYRGEKQSRVVSRIVRDLERQLVSL